MMSIAGLGKAGSKNRQGKGPTDYYKDVELAKLAYYMGKDGKPIEAKPEWVGKGAATLGLAGELNLDFKDVEMLAQGLGPKGEELVKGAGARHKVGDDFTFSANKFVSLAFAMADDDTQRGILEDFREATKSAIGFLEKNAVTRLGEDGHRHEKVKGITCAVFQHFASRELDPQLHAHVLVFNAAERQDGKFGTLDGKPFYEMKMTAGALWRADLAARLAKRGFEIEKEGKDNFQIKGIKPKQVEAFSTRRQQILEELKRKGKSGPEAAQRATMATRRIKDEPPLGDLMESWKKQGAEMGLDEAAVAAMIAKGLANPPTKAFELDEKAVLSRLTEQHSTFQAHEVLKAIAIEAVGHWDLARCELAADEIMKGESVLHLGKGRDANAPPRFTTVERYELEKAIGLSAERRSKENEHAVPKGTIELAVEAQAAKQGFELNAEQRAAVDFICKDTGGIACVEGWAGTGKTTLLTTVNEVYKAHGFKLTGTALAGKAAEGLEKEAGIPSQTLASLLMQLDNKSKHLDTQSVVVIDEAGMVGSRMFSRLQQHADLAGAKLVLVGDPKQLQSIEAGGIMRSLMERVGKVELQDINRQKTDVKALRRELTGKMEDGRRTLSPRMTEAIKKVEDKGLLEWAKDLAGRDDDVAAAFSRWQERSDYHWLRGTVKDLASDGVKGKGLAGKAVLEFDKRGLLRVEDNRKEAIAAMVAKWGADSNAMKDKLMLAGTNEEVFQANLAARELLIETGALKAGPADKSMRVHLTKSGSSYRDLVVGDRIVFKANDKKLGVKNGMLGTVESVSDGAGGGRLRVRLDSDHGPGKIAAFTPDRYSSIDYGWCVSTHKSQGVTVNACYVYVSETMANREWSYVAASRSRYKTELFAVEGDGSHLLDENDRKLDKAALSAKEKDANLAQMGARMGRSAAKDTTLDYAGASTHRELEARKVESAILEEASRRKAAEAARQRGEGGRSA